MSAALYDHKPEAYNEKGQMEKEQSARENPEDGHLRPVIADAFALREGEEGEDFKTLGWFKAGLVITCEAIALGTLSFPKNFYALGLVGGLIANAGFVVIAFFTSCVMVDFKLRYTHVLNAADAGQVMFGRIGFWVLGIAMIAKSIGLAASHVLAGKIAIATFDGGANCSIIWAVVIAVVSAGLSYHRKWSGLTWLSWISLTCIVTACIITMAGVATQNPERLIKNNVPIEWHAFNRDAKLVDSIGAVLNSAFSYGQTMAVLTFLPEMRRPETFKRSMLLSQIISLVLYSIVGSVCYVYAGQYVTSPALTMTTHTLRIVSYAFALVTIVVSGIVACNVGAKFWYTTSLRNSALLTSKGGQLVWLAIIGAMWTIGFVLAELIPFFGDLLTIVSALTSSWFVVGLGGVLWLHLYKKKGNPDGGYFKTPLRTFFFFFSVLLILISCALTPLGLYAAIEGIKSGYAKGKFHHPFSCAA